MWMVIIVSLGTIHIIGCSHISSLNQYDSDSSDKHEWNKNEDIDKSREELLDKSSHDTKEKSREEISILHTTMEPSVGSVESNVNRRYWLVASKVNVVPNNKPVNVDNEKDANLKSKIATLVEQTLHDTNRKLRTLNRLKETYKEEAAYKIGFILSLIKKSKVVLNELFNVAVKHRDEYKALEELKIFEFIVHTNVDTTNLVRQMVEIHIQYYNSTYPLQFKHRVFLW